jgi:DNA-binding response OmpR family regulator
MKKKILLIEDEESIREYMSFLLQNNGFQVIEAKNGAEGMTFFSKEKFDLVVTDIVMPEKDGMEIMQAVREIDPKTIMLAVSGAMSYRDLLAGAGKSGADEVIQKPFTENEFLKIVNCCLNRNPA